jgi:xylulokinase
MTASPDEYVLALDLGTSGCKAALVDMHGTVHSWESEDVETLILPGGGAEQRPQDWIRAILTASKRLVGRFDSPQKIKAICPNTQGEGTVPIGEDREPLSNAILWMDTRGSDLVRQNLGGAINVAGYSASKILQYLRITGGAPSLTGKDQVGHIMFIRDQWPDIYSKTYKFLSVLDYLLLQFTGRYVSSYDMSVTTWITDNRDSTSISYNDKLCNLIGVDKNQFPKLVPSTEIVGTLAESIAAEIGLSADCKVVAGAMDTSAAAVGSGAVSDGDPHIYLGTSSWMGAHVPYKKTDIISSIASIPCAIPGKYLMTALQATAGGNLTFLRDKVLRGDDPVNNIKDISSIFDTFNVLVEASKPGAKGMMYTPWIYGERAPIEDPDIRASLHNISLNHTRADMVRAVFEGVALNTRWLLGPMEKFLGGACESIAVVGGGAKSDAWCQIFADVMDRPIRQIEDPIGANVRGSAYVASVALGHITFDDIPKLTKTRKIFEPSQQYKELYDFHFREFQNLYKAHKKICRRLNQFHKKA